MNMKSQMPASCFFSKILLKYPVANMLDHVSFPYFFLFKEKLYVFPSLSKYMEAYLQIVNN